MAEQKIRTRITGSDTTANQNASADGIRQEIRAYLDEAIEEYARAEGSPGSGRFAPEPVLDRLALVALTRPRDEALTTNNMALTGFCANSGGDQASERAGGPLHLPGAKALLVRHLLRRTLGSQNDASLLALEEVAVAYAHGSKTWPGACARPPPNPGNRSTPRVRARLPEKTVRRPS